MLGFARSRAKDVIMISGMAIPIRKSLYGGAHCRDRIVVLWYIAINVGDSSGHVLGGKTWLMYYCNLVARRRRRVRNKT